MFWPSNLHQRQISHADNNTTIIHDIYRVFIDIIRSNCYIINNGQGFIQLEKASRADSQEVFNDCIHLLSLIFLKMASSFQHLLMIMTDRSASVWLLLVKWAATRDLFVRLWVKLKQWLLIRERRGCPVSPKYWRPHLLTV